MNEHPAELPGRVGRRDSRACLGPCNRRYHRAWDDYDADMAVWKVAYASWKAAQAAAKLSEASRVSAGTSRPHKRSEPPAPPVKPRILGWLGDPHWCATCRATVRAAISSIDVRATELDAWCDGHRGIGSGEAVSRRRADAGSPSPIVLTLDELYAEVTCVEDTWRAGHRPPFPAVRRGTGRGTAGRSAALGFIAVHLSAILASEEHKGLGTRLLRWERLLLLLAKSDPVVRSRPGRCPKCQRVETLYIRDGMTKCRADDCGLWLNEEEYERRVLGAGDQESVVRESRRVAGVADRPQGRSRGGKVAS